MKKLFYVSLLVSLFFAAPLCAKGKNGLVTKPLFTMNDAQKKTDNIEAEIQYPVFAGKKDLNAKIEKSVFDGYEEFLNGLKTANMIMPFYYGVTSSPVIANDEFISVLFTIYTYSGGANGETKLKSVTYSPRDKEILSAAEATGLSIEEISAICTEKLLASYPKGDAELIKAGASASADNFRNFTFDGNLLTVYFEPYQVAPHSEGVVKVEIPVGAVPFSK